MSVVTRRGWAVSLCVSGVNVVTGCLGVEFMLSGSGDNDMSWDSVIDFKISNNFSCSFNTIDHNSVFLHFKRSDLSQ